MDDIKATFPQKYWYVNTDNIVLKKQIGHVPESLFISGPAGTGKTVFACSVGKKFMRAGWPVRFINYPSFIIELQGEFNGGDPYDMAKEVAEYESILIIDDLGAEKLTEFVGQMTYYILNEREQNERLTIITSNFSLAEFDEKIDPRIASRIAGMCKIMYLGGNDRRIVK